MKHYFYPGRSITTDWMLKELDAPHEQIFVDFPAGESTSPEFRAINPMCKVPALVDGDTVVTEVAAICAYLADKFPEKKFAPSPGSTERGKYYRYLFFTNVTLEPVLTPLDSSTIPTVAMTASNSSSGSVMATRSICFRARSVSASFVPGGIHIRA